MGRVGADELIGAIYDAALAPESWPVVLSAMSVSVGSVAAALMVQDRSSAAARIDYVTQHGFTEIRAYSDHFVHIDTRVATLAASRPEEVLADGLTIDFAETMRTEAWQDFYRAAGIGGGMGIRLSSTGGGVATLSFQRPLDGVLFQPEDVARLRQYGAHVDRAFRLQRRMLAAHDVAHALRQGLDRFPTAVLLVDAAMTIVEMNQAATLLLARLDQPLRCRGGRLATAGAAEADGLRQVVDGAFRSIVGGGATGNGDGRGPPPLLRLRTADPKRPLAMLATPVRRLAGQPRTDLPLVLLFVSEPAGSGPADRGRLAVEFGLTAAEADIAAALLAGRRIGDIAATRGASPETVRTQIKSVLHKTGTASQAQLVSLLAQGVSRLL